MKSVVDRYGPGEVDLRGTMPNARGVYIRWRFDVNGEYVPNDDGGVCSTAFTGGNIPNSTLFSPDRFNGKCGKSILVQSGWNENLVSRYSVVMSDMLAMYKELHGEKDAERLRLEEEKAKGVKPKF